MMKMFKKPKKFDFNLIVIGAGSAGLTCAYLASQLKAKVALVEKSKMGGDCLNTGCVPSKSLIRSAKILALQNKAKQLGFESLKIDANFESIIHRVHQRVKKIAPHDSIERYQELGVTCFQDSAQIVNPYQVKIGETVYSTKAIVIATGAKPNVIPFKGLDTISYLTSDTIWNLKNLPKNLLVIGAGPIGCELAQCFQRLGSQVSIVDVSNRLLSRLDQKVSQVLTAQFQKEGLKTFNSHHIQEFKKDTTGQKFLLVKDSKNHEKKIFFDEVLMALGRKARVQDLGLEALDIKISKAGTLVCDDFMATNYPNIFVCGDVTSSYQFTHMASYQAYFACLNALFRPYTNFVPAWLKNKYLKAKYDIVPWALYTDPEVAQAGLSKQQLLEKKIPYQSVMYEMKELDRAITDNEDEGYIEVLTPPKTDKILGVTIVHARASEMISEFILAMTHNLGLKAILSSIHIYPTLNEANKYVAGKWMRTQKSEKTLSYLKKFHNWRRG